MGFAIELHRQMEALTREKGQKTEEEECGYWTGFCSMQMNQYVLMALCVERNSVKRDVRGGVSAGIIKTND